MHTRIEVDCATGEVRELELTAEELAQKEADEQAFLQQQAEQQAQIDAQEATRQAGLAKLIALGLTEEEAQALVS